MLATPWHGNLPAGEWLVERKFDGWRVLASRGAAWTRRGQDVSANLPHILAPLEGYDDVVLDGEAVVASGDKEDFGRLASLLGSSSSPESREIRFVVFDVLRENGDVMDLPLLERRRILQGLNLPRQTFIVSPVQRVDAAGAERMREGACRRGWEGLIAKRPESRYEPGTRSRNWLKVKCWASKTS